ncbi:hypothetical protein FQA39_LY00255 [Lamprigera yunnana]|nr:hypothetical protein FQA39_LY00255 [Lamprigera yunnana]
MEKKTPSLFPTLENIKKIIKHDNVINSRLQSLRIPKDLNLGGTKPKKVYTPNLNVVRTKDKKKLTPNKPTSRKRLQEEQLDNKLQVKFKRIKYVQSDGIFSQGLGEVKTSQRNERANSIKEHTNSLPIPRINKNDSVIRDKDKSRLPLLKNGYIDDDSDTESEPDQEYDPIVLPLGLNREPFTKGYSIKKIKEEPGIKIKVEPGEQIPPIVSKPMFIHENTKVKIEKVDVIEDDTAFTNSKECDEDNHVISLMQLPDSFFGKVFSDDPEKNNLDYTLKQFPEGQIGKICIRRSGKMEFVVNGISFHLNSQQMDNFTEVAVQFPGEQSIALEPSLVTLGSVSERLLVNPEWNNLFGRAKIDTKYY